jgi:integrase
MSAGVDMRMFATHDFRRCFARRVWEKWKDVNILQSVLNHADPKTTLRYLQQSGLRNVDYFKIIQVGDDDKP